jgi:hypothetical protein
MLRSRFRANEEDPRPVIEAVRPWWITGYGDDYAIVVAYVDDEADLLRRWPEATHIDSAESESYAFTSRFPKPEWFQEGVA